jgi:hypothetical protein
MKDIGKVLGTQGRTRGGFLLASLLASSVMATCWTYTTEQCAWATITDCWATVRCSDGKDHSVHCVAVEDAYEYPAAPLTDPSKKGVDHIIGWPGCQFRASYTDPFTHEPGETQCINPPEYQTPDLEGGNICTVGG